MRGGGGDADDAPYLCELTALGWRVELDLAWARLALGQAAEVPRELHALSLSAPPSLALADELRQLLSAAAAAGAPRPR